MNWDMILKMSLATAFYILVTWAVRKVWVRKKPGIGARILVGLLFGGCSVLSTHIGVNYNMMVLNVRDIGPLAAGLFFHPLSGIIAGLVGGVERYIAGACWKIGEYTTLACSVSTVLAGILPAVLHYKMQKGSRTPVLLSFFLGALMEVFHMYAVFLTHRNDIRTAYEVVKVCAAPMIIFTGLGLAGCSLAARLASGEGLDRKVQAAARKSLSHKFQFWLMMGTCLIFAINFAVSFALQTRTALENAEYKMQDWSEDLKKAVIAAEENTQKMSAYIKKELLRDTGVIASGLQYKDSFSTMTAERLDRIRSAAGFRSLLLLAADGSEKLAVGEPVFDLTQSYTFEGGYVSFQDLLAGKAESTLLHDGNSILAVIRCGSGYLCSANSFEGLWNDLSFTYMENIYQDYQFSGDAYYLIFAVGEKETYRVAGMLPQESAETLSEQTAAILRSHLDGKIFYSDHPSLDGFCMCKPIDDDGFMYSLVVYPSYAAFKDRDAEIYENLFSDILLFVGLYLIITALMRRMVVEPLGSVNASLQKITAGELNETVNVRSATEFELLSDEINTTVDALKGYISAAEKRMEQELTLARTIQDSALPRNFTFPRADFELFATMDPAKEVGGDFYDFFFTGPDRLALVIADVSGKGIPGALFMMQAKAAIRNQAETGISPAEVFTKANHVLCDGNDAEMFVTAWIGIIDLRTGKMACANAGHEYPILCRAGGEYEIFKDKHTLPLAAMDGVPMKEYEMDLHPGDRLFVYTDGIPEAVNTQNDAYGADRLLAVLNSLRAASQENVLKAVREDLRAFVGAADQFDDITMLGFVFRGPQ